MVHPQQLKPKASKETIELHMRTYRSALQSSKEIEVSTLIPTYLKMQPLLHKKAESDQVDREALRYALHRFPKEILKTKKIVIGQTKEIFSKAGYDISSWREVEAPKRRRHIHYHPEKQIMACFAASISDVDDIVNLTICLEIELNKAVETGLTEFDNVKLPKKSLDYKIKLLSGSWINFAKTAQSWWEHIQKNAKNKFDLDEQSLVLVSSNNHSLINLIDNFCINNQKEIFKEVKNKFPKVNKLIKNSTLPKKYLAYFASQFTFKTNKKLWNEKLEKEKELGILRIEPETNLEIETQIIPGKLFNEKLSDTAVLNIEYPLGFSAYHLLEEVLENTRDIRALFILGKAAALNTKVGDILIPKIAFDEHTQNTYMLDNCFNKQFPDEFQSGSILDNQRLVSVIGTYMENQDLFDEYSKKEFNIIEMEAGPYLGAVTQATYAKPLPQEAIVDLYNPPFTLGLVYYSSDNPYILSDTLGDTMGLSGIEATYLSSQAIINKIQKLT
jgi:hypothetical protein